MGPFPVSFRALTAGNVFGLPVLTLYLLVIAVVLWYFLEHTPWGRRIYATGANPDAARLAGVRTNSFLFWSFVISGTGASVAGVLLASNLNSVSESLGPQYLLPAFAAAFLGITQLKPGRFNIWGTVLAIYLLGTGVQGLMLAGADLWVTDVFNGLALLIAVVDHGIHAGAARAARGEGQGERSGRRCSRRLGFRRNGSEAAPGLSTLSPLLGCRGTHSRVFECIIQTIHTGRARGTC